MKNKTFNIIKMFFSLAFVITAFSCGDITDSTESTGEKPLLRIRLSDNNERTVVPDTDFSSFNFVLKTGDKELGRYESEAELKDTVIDLAANGVNVGNEASFTLEAKKGGISWSGSGSKTIEAGENTVEVKLFVTALGTGNGSFSYTLDFSTAQTKDDVVSAHVIVTPVSDSSTSPIIDDWYGLNEAGSTAAKSISTDGKITLEKANVPAGSYRLTAEFYADTGTKGKLLLWNENIVVAAETKSTGIGEIKELNKAYTVIFDKNYEESTPYKVKVSLLTPFSEFAPQTPRRIGYIFKGWYKDPECNNQFYEYTDSSRVKDTTVYAKWEEFAPGAKTVSVQNTSTIKVSSDTYTITEFTETNKVLWYKFATEENKEYNIFHVNSYSSDNFIYDETQIASASIILYSNDALSISMSGDAGHYSFTAKSSETFIKLTTENAYSNSVGKCAFCVYQPNADVTDSFLVDVSVLNDDIGVSTREGKDIYWDSRPPRPYMYFNVTNSSDYEDFKWYVNGEQFAIGYTYYNYFYYGEYIPGVYTVTLEAKRKTDNKVYSYSAQVTVPENN